MLPKSTNSRLTLMGISLVSVQPHHPHSNKIYGNTAFSGSNSSIRLLGQVGNFSKVPFSQT